jgi:hypothetical protein
VFFFILKVIYVCETLVNRANRDILIDWVTFVFCFVTLCLVHKNSNPALFCFLSTQISHLLNK